MRNTFAFSMRKLIRPALIAALGVVSLVGCDEKKEGPVVDTNKHGETSTKNMENFMKNQAAQPKEKEAPKAQTK
jgi:hypothetical protein